MYKVVFGDTVYELIPSGYFYEENKLNFYILANELELDEVEETLLQFDNVRIIRVLDDEEHLIQTFRDFIVLKEIKKIYNYIYESYINEDGNNIDSTTDVIVCELSKIDIREQTDKNTADIEYIAIIENIEL